VGMETLQAGLCPAPPCIVDIWRVWLQPSVAPDRCPLRLQQELAPDPGLRVATWSISLCRLCAPVHQPFHQPYIDNRPSLHSLHATAFVCQQCASSHQACIHALTPVGACLCLCLCLCVFCRRAPPP
jgi:hypothetical protein